MATGPEHFRKAEEYADYAATAYQAGTPTLAADAAAIGQIHATLALAAATVDAGTVHVPAAHQAWKAALGGTPAAQPTCAETCCTSGLWREAGAHTCTQVVDHGGEHVSPHTTWRIVEPASGGEVG